MMFKKIVFGMIAMLLILIGGFVKVPLFMIAGLAVLIFLLYKTEWGD